MEIGSPPEKYDRFFRGAHLRSIADLFGGEGSGVDAAYYATSWALFSFLLDEHYDQLARYLQRLNELPQDRRAEAWREVFPDLPPEELDHQLSKWLRTGEFRLARIPVTMHDFAATECRDARI